MENILDSVINMLKNIRANFMTLIIKRLFYRYFMKRYKQTIWGKIYNLILDYTENRFGEYNYSIY